MAPRVQNLTLDSRTTDRSRRSAAAADRSANGASGRASGRRRARPRAPVFRPGATPGLLFDLCDLIVAQHPDVGRKRNKVGLVEIFLVGFGWRAGPEQKFANRGGGLGVRLL